MGHRKVLDFCFKLLWVKKSTLFNLLALYLHLMTPVPVFLCLSDLPSMFDSQTLCFLFQLARILLSKCSYLLLTSFPLCSNEQLCYVYRITSFLGLEIQNSSPSWRDLIDNLSFLWLTIKTSIKYI